MWHPLGPHPPMYHAQHQKDGYMTTSMIGFVVIYATHDHTTIYFVWPNGVPKKGKRTLGLS
jgi:hypothetical protein